MAPSRKNNLQTACANLCWLVLLILLAHTGLSEARGFLAPETVELAPLGDLKIKVRNTTGQSIQGIQVKILAPTLAKILGNTTYRFSGQLKSGQERVLVLKTKTNGKLWLKLMEKSRMLAQNHTSNNVLSVSAIGQSPIYPVLQIKKQPITQISHPRLIFVGDHGSYIWRNLSKKSLKLGKIQFDALPPQVKVIRDTCSNRKLGANRTCAVDMTLSNRIGTLKHYRVTLPFTALLPNKRVNGLVRMAVETGNGMDVYITPNGTVGAPEGIYGSSCQNISFDDGQQGYPLTAECTFFNGGAFSTREATLDYSSCMGGGALTGEVTSNPYTGQLYCAEAATLATQTPPPGDYASQGCETASYDPATQYLSCSNIGLPLYYPGCQGGSVSYSNKTLVCANGFSSAMTDINNMTKLWAFDYAVKDGSTWNPWAPLSCESSSGDCSNSTGLSVYSNPLLSTSNFGWQMTCPGEAPGYQVAPPPPAGAYYSSQAGLTGLGPLNNDPRTTCPPYYDDGIQMPGAFFIGNQNQLYYSHGNTMRGCNTYTQGQGLLQTYGNGIFGEAFYWWQAGNVNPPFALTSCNTIADTFGFTPENPNYAGQTGFGENYQVIYEDADWPYLGGMDLITPGAKYYPQYAFFMANSTSEAVTVPANSFYATYCQNVPGWEEAGYVIGEALAMIMAAGVPVPGADGAGEFVTWTMNAAAATSVITESYGDVTADHCSNGGSMQTITFPNADTTIPPGWVTFLGAQELDDFDYFVTWGVPNSLTPGSSTPLSYQETDPLVFNDGFHAIIFSVDNNNVVKVSALNDTGQFSLPNIISPSTP